MSNKLNELLKLAQLDQMSAGPQQAQQGQMMQMLMSMLQMNQQGEQAASGQDLERERMAQAAKQFQDQLGLNRETAGQEQDYRMGQQGIAKQTMENALANQQLMGGLDLAKIMQDRQNQELLARQHEKEFELKAKDAADARAQAMQMAKLEALAKGASVNAVSPEQFRSAYEIAFPGSFPTIVAPAPGSPEDMEKKLKEAKDKQGFQLPPRTGLSSPIMEIIRGLQDFKSMDKKQLVNLL